MSVGTAIPMRQADWAETTKPRISGYEVMEICGEGAMGTVWRAIQLGTRRPVALKLMRSHVFASEKARLRFDREVELTARLDHPNIARIYDSGVHEGVFFYAMELIEGQPLDVYVQHKDLTHRQILELFQTVCEALEHAHLRGVIHRDLKPSNILVDKDGRPHVLDFGLAKAMLEETRVHDVSLEGDIAGTPAFMSPEQAAGLTQTLDTRTDVFSLGVILYRLLCGQPPHDLSGSYQDLMRRIVEQDPIRPRQACPELDRELEALLLKALARDREQRYATAGALAADIDNYLHGEPLMARVPTTAYFLRKRLRRYRLPLTIAAGVLLALLAVAVVAYVRIAQERNAAIAAEKAAEAQRQRAEAEARAAELARGQSLIRLGDMHAARGETLEALEQYQGAYRVLQPLGASRHAEIGIFEMLRQSPPPLITWKTAAGGAMDLTLLADGRTAVLACSDGSVRFWDLITGTLTRRVPTGSEMTTTIAVSADGRHLLTGGTNGKLALWSPDGEKVASFTAGDGWVRQVAISVDGTLAIASVGAPAVMLGGASDSLVLIDLRDGRQIFSVPADDMVSHVAISPDQTRVLAAGTKVTLRSSSDGRILATFAGHTGSITSAQFAPDGKRILTAGTDRTIRLWNGESPDDGAVLAQLPRAITSAMFAPDGRAIVAVTDDHVAYRLDAETGAILRRQAATVAGAVNTAGLSADGSLLVALSLEDELTVWDLHSIPEGAPLAPAGEPVRSIAFLADMPVLLGHAGERVIAWDVPTGRRLAIPDLDRRATAFALSPNGRVLTIADGRQMAVYDLRRSQWRNAGSELPADVSLMALSPNGQVIAAALADGRVITHDVLTSQRVELLSADTRHMVRTLAFTADSRRLAAGGVDRTVRVWDLVTGELIAQFAAHSQAINTIAMTEDGTWLASGSGNLPSRGSSQDYSIRLWPTDGTATSVIVGRHDLRVRSLAFIEPLKWLISSGDDGTIRLWDASPGSLGDRAIRTIGGHASAVGCVIIDRDGWRMVSADDGGAVRHWDFTLAARQLAVQPSLRSIGDHPTAQRNAASLRELGQWYALRGHWAWAIQAFQAAQARGADVTDLELARLCWQAGDAAKAVEAFDRAIAGASDDQLRYLQLCRDSAATDAANGQ